MKYRFSRTFEARAIVEEYFDLDIHGMRIELRAFGYAEDEEIEDMTEDQVIESFRDMLSGLPGEFCDGTDILQIKDSNSATDYKMEKL